MNTILKILSVKNLIIFFSLFVGLAAAAQKNKDAFTLLVLQPDTAILEGSLQSEIKTVEQDQQDKYHAAIHQMESVINAGYSKETEKQMSRTCEEIKKTLQQLKEKNPDQFRYYHLLSSELTEECIRHYAGNPLVRITEHEFKTADVPKLNDLCNKMNCDYVVFFTDVRGETTGNSPVLKITTSLYSRKDNAVIYSQPAEVCCDSKRKSVLSSLLRDAALSSFEQIVAVLKEKG